jgi:sugar/nucleoside kinase (ribokinase family)
MLQACNIYCSGGAKKPILDLGAGNSFLGGLAAGLSFSKGDVYEGELMEPEKQRKLKGFAIAALFATVSASFAIEQGGLPSLTPNPQDPDAPNCNGDSPMRRLEKLRERLRN